MLHFLVGLLAGIIGVLLAVFLLKKQPKELSDDQFLQLIYENNFLREQVGGLKAHLGSKEKELEDRERLLAESEAKLQQEQERNVRVLSMKKSSEVRTGQIAEQLSPLLFGNHDPKRLRWIGNPCDFIAFDTDRITFIEVKSGRSQLSFNQKQLKKLILLKKVEWEEVRIGSRKK